MAQPSLDDQPDQEPAGRHGWRRPSRLWILRLVRARARTFFAALTMVVIWVASGAFGHGALSAGVRFLVAWNVGAILWLAMAFIMMARSDAARMRKRSAEQDEGAALILLVSCVASTACLVAIASVLGGETTADGAQSWRIGLGVLTIVTAWLFMHMTFTLHYAHAWYEPNGSDLLFPDKEMAPDYFDFAYFALTIGVACQTADVALRGKRMRRLVTVQAVLAFFFNTAVLALGVNVAASIVGGK